MNETEKLQLGSFLTWIPEVQIVINILTTSTFLEKGVLAIVPLFLLNSLLFLELRFLVIHIACRGIWEGLIKWPVTAQTFMLKYYISMIFFLNVGHGISIRKCEYFGSRDAMLSSMKAAFIHCWGQKESAMSCRAVCSECPCRDFIAVLCWAVFYFQGMANCRKGLFSNIGNDESSGIRKSGYASKSWWFMQSRSSWRWVIAQ